VGGIDRGEIDSHGRDLSKKMPAGAGIGETELMARAGCRTTAKSTTENGAKQTAQSGAARSEARRLRHYAILP
jgi:hypothetical protein